MSLIIQLLKLDNIYDKANIQGYTYNCYEFFFFTAVQHERKPVSDRTESIHNMSTSPDNNNIPTFHYGNNSFIKNEMPFIKNEVHFIKTEMPYVGHRSIYNDQSALNILQSSSNIFKKMFTIYAYKSLMLIFYYITTLKFIILIFICY